MAIGSMNRNIGIHSQSSEKPTCTEWLASSTIISPLESGSVRQSKKAKMLSTVSISGFGAFCGRRAACVVPGGGNLTYTTCSPSEAEDAGGFGVALVLISALDCPTPSSSALAHLPV